MIYLGILAFAVVYAVAVTSILMEPPKRRRTAAERHTRSHWDKL